MPNRDAFRPGDPRPDVPVLPSTAPAPAAPRRAGRASARRPRRAGSRRPKSWLTGSGRRSGRSATRPGCRDRSSATSGGARLVSELDQHPGRRPLIVAPPISGLMPAASVPRARADRIASRTPGTCRIGPTLTNGLLGQNTIRSAASIASTTPGAGQGLFDAPHLHGADGDVGAPMHEVLLEVHPRCVFLQLDPRLDRLVGHRQDVDALDAQPLGQLGRDSARRPAGLQQLGPSQMRRQVDVAQTEPGLAAQPLERVHALERVAARSPATLFVDHARERVQHRVDVGRDAQARAASRRRPY